MIELIGIVGTVLGAIATGLGAIISIIRLFKKKRQENEDSEPARTAAKDVSRITKLEYDLSYFRIIVENIQVALNQIREELLNIREEVLEDRKTARRRGDDK